MEPEINSGEQAAGKEEGLEEQEVASAFFVCTSPGVGARECHTGARGPTAARRCEPGGWKRGDYKLLTVQNVR